MNKSDSIKALAAALVKAQAEMRPAPLNVVNQFLKNRYADLGSIIETARPVLARHGLSFVQLVGSEPGGWITVETMILHESGEYISEQAKMPVSDEKGKSMAQVSGSTITYLRRYSLAAILGMYADEDTDGNHQPQQRKEQAPQAQMTLESAIAMTGSDGVKYGDRDNATLSAIANNEKAPAEKRQAARMILDSRSK